jgi:hypothetical protein
VKEVSSLGVDCNFFFFFFFFVENEVAEIRQIPISSFNGMDQQI